MQALLLALVAVVGDQRTNETFDAHIPPYFSLESRFQSTLFHDHISCCRETYLFTSFKGDATMKKSLVLTAVAALLVGALAGAFFTLHMTTPAAQANGQRVIHVIEHALTDTVGDADNGTPSPDALGNVLAFHNPVFNSANSKQVGKLSLLRDRSQSKGHFLMMALIQLLLLLVGPVSF
jgi:hypothetical protein